jgi:hypothetical protein
MGIALQTMVMILADPTLDCISSVLTYKFITFGCGAMTLDVNPDAPDVTDDVPSDGPDTFSYIAVTLSDTLYEFFL